MSVKKYLELDSTYRNTLSFPKPGQFEVNIAQGANRTQASAVNPVSNASTISNFRFQSVDATQYTLTVAQGGCATFTAHRLIGNHNNYLH